MLFPENSKTSRRVGAVLVSDDQNALNKIAAHLKPDMPGLTITDTIRFAVHYTANRLPGPAKGEPR